MGDKVDADVKSVRKAGAVRASNGGGRSKSSHEAHERRLAFIHGIHDTGGDR